LAFKGNGGGGLIADFGQI